MSEVEGHVVQSSRSGLIYLSFVIICDLSFFIPEPSFFNRMQTIRNDK